tara:strand:- start:1395 stop:2639 length:1245 start_codon:yes stop_codon:yes gene_type:complete
MARDIGSITTAQTFENWFTKTNDLVGALRTATMTASPGAGDTVEGNSTLVGILTASNLVASTLLSTNDIGARSGAVINFQDPIAVASGVEIAATFNYAGTGAQVRFTDGSISWDAGMDSDGNNNFVIDTGVAPVKFLLTPAGTMTVPNAVVTENLTVGSLTIGAGGAGFNSDDIDEGVVNLYHSPAKVVAALSGGDGINISAAGEISFDGEGELSTYQGNEFINTGSVGTGIKAYMTGSQSTGVPVGRLSSLWSGTTYNVLNWTPGGVDVQGAITTTGDVEVKSGVFRVGTQSSLKASIDQSGNGFFTGNVTTFGSTSDRRLKENIVPLTGCLEKTNQLNGVMFNYIDRPEDTIPGVIAQEVEAVLPEAVYNIEMEDDTYKAVRYQQLVPLLIEAIKELTEKVNTLENRLNNDG